jgi:hypothetical protein
MTETDPGMPLATRALAELAQALESGSRDSAERAREALEQACAAAGGRLTFGFAGDLLFVGGCPLTAERAVWERAAVLAQRCRAAGVAEITIDSTVHADELIALCDDFAPSGSGGSRGIRLRELGVPSGPRQTANAADHLLEAYASSVLAVRDMHAAFEQGELALPRAVKRSACRLASLAPSESFLALTTLATAHRGDADRAVQTAVVALAIARELTTDARLLQRLALVALLGELGRPLLGVSAGRSPDADASLELHVPAAAAAACLVSSDSSTAAWRATIAFEVASLDRGSLAGAPMVASRVLHVARVFLEAIAPRDGRAGVTPPEALASLEDDPELQAFAARALGRLPVGTVVELEDGSWAIVSGRAAGGDPPVLVVADGRGRPLFPPQARVAAEIRAVVPRHLARFNVAHAFFGA